MSPHRVRAVGEQEQFGNHRERRLAAELSAMARLHELVARLLVSSDLPTALDEVLGASMEITGATMGNVQLLNRAGDAMEIVTHRGFRQDFLDYFRSVPMGHDSACGRALAAGERVIIEDVRADPGYAPHRRIAAAAGYRAVQSTPLLSRANKPLGVLSTHYPEPSRPAERELRMLDLYARQAAEFIEHVRGREAMRAADRRKDEFLAMLGHELRNPLGPMFNAVALLRRSDIGEERRDELLDMLERQGRQLARLVDDLLDVSRITRGKIRLRRRAIDLRQVIDNVAQAHMREFDARGQELVLEVSDQPLVVAGDPVRLEQIIGNLLDNAAKFSPQGARTEVRATRAGGEVVVEIADRGAGMDDAMKRDAFELFVQGDRSLARGEGGLGVGLSTAHRLSQMHGGSLEVESEGPGHGCTFTMRLPAKQTGVAKPTAREDSARRARPGSGRRVLVVEDNPDAAGAMADLLRLSGHVCWVAADGVEALRLFDEREPEAVVLDLGLPGMDGLEVAARIRQKQAGHHALLIALTGYGGKATIKAAREAGFDHHLLKPADPTVIGTLLAKMERR